LQSKEPIEPLHNICFVTVELRAISQQASFGQEKLAGN